MRILSSARTCMTAWCIQIPTFHPWRFAVIIQCWVNQYSVQTMKNIGNRKGLSQGLDYIQSFSTLNTNTTYLANMQCFSFAERIATSFCNHQSTKTKKPQKGVGNQSQNSVSLSRKLIRILMLERAPEKGYKHLIMKKNRIQEISDQDSHMLFNIQLSVLYIAGCLREVLVVSRKRPCSHFGLHATTEDRK